MFIVAIDDNVLAEESVFNSWQSEGNNMRGVHIILLEDSGHMRDIANG